MDQETLRTFIITIPLILTAWAGLRASRKIEKVYREVKSGNELMTGQLASAAETRRIADIPHEERTAQEQRHLEQLPLPAKGNDPPFDTE